jgi:hypothetical protein
MQILVRYSGNSSTSVILYLSNALKDSFPKATPFLADADPESGFRRQLSVGKLLQPDDCAIVVLTPDSRRSDWLLFEVGVLVGSIPTDQIVLVVAGMETSDIPIGPLREINAYEFDESGMERMFEQLGQQISRIDENATVSPSAHRNYQGELKSAIQTNSDLFPDPVRQPVPDYEGFTHTMTYLFDLEEDARHKLDAIDSETCWNDNIRLFINYIGATSLNEHSRFRYSALAVGYPTTNDGKAALHQKLYKEIGIEIGELTMVDIRTQKIYASFEEVVQY